MFFRLPLVEASRSGQRGEAFPVGKAPPHNGRFGAEPDRRSHSVFFLKQSWGGLISLVRSEEIRPGRPRGRNPMLCNNASGPEIVVPCQISARFLSGKLQNQPYGRLKASRRADFEIFQTRTRPNSSPEALLHNIIGICV